MRMLQESTESIDEEVYKHLLVDCECTLDKGNKIIVSGLGKNVPICDKFVGTMNSLGMDSAFLHTNSAVHGDLGIVRDGDLVIILTKSGSTVESVHLKKELDKRDVIQWLITFEKEGVLAKEMDRVLCIQLEHEGDMWNLVPNNSTIMNLLVLQTVAMDLAVARKIPLEVFHKNHPGGHIGEILNTIK